MIIILGMLAYDVILTLNLYVADLEYELLSLISVLFQWVRVAGVVCSKTVIDKIIPHAVSWYTEEALSSFWRLRWRLFDISDDDNEGEEEEEQEQEMKELLLPVFFFMLESLNWFYFVVTVYEFMGYIYKSTVKDPEIFEKRNATKFWRIYFIYWVGSCANDQNSRVFACVN